MDQILHCKDVSKRYSKKMVLDKINLDLEPGKIYGLIGRNGVGKTTLLSILSSQNPATSGSVTLGNEPVWENRKVLDHICFSREISAVTAFGQNSLRIKDYLKTASIFMPNWDRDMAERLVKEFELDRKKKVAKLSKGMMSMLTIIIALASKAEYTFLDEPVAGLDVVARDRFYHLLLEDYSKTGRTFIISTHIIEEAADIFEEVIILNDGRVALKENTQELMERCFHISGKREDVDAVCQGLTQYHQENMGRSKGVTVLLEPGQSIQEDYNVSVQPVSLQNLFVALCGKDMSGDI